MDKWEARKMEYGKGRWAAFHPRGYWTIPAYYGKKAAERLARKLNAQVL